LSRLSAGYILDVTVVVTAVRAASLGLGAGGWRAVLLVAADLRTRMTKNLNQNENLPT
jgi:hypothetical protein